MVTSRELLDSITAYQEARKSEGMMRTEPPAKSVDQLAEEAGQNLRDFVRDSVGKDLGAGLLKT